MGKDVKRKDATGEIMKKILFLTAGVMLIMVPILSAALTAEPNASSIKVYDMFEVTVNSDFGVKDPYNYSEIDVQGTFTSPEGRTYTIDGFYMDDFSVSNGNYTKKPGSFRVRYAPQRSGKWKYSVKATAGSKVLFSSPERTLMVSRDPSKKGFLRVSKNDPLFLSFDNKESFYGIGMNAAWYKTGFEDYERWMGSMKDNSMNLMRLWMAAWGLGIEWDTLAGDYGARQKQAFIMDRVLDLAAKDDIYIILTLISHGEYSTKINPVWESNPYNIKNNGLIDKPSEFFTNPAARKAFKNRMRYIMARWGYSQNILCWELFNEVDLTDDYNSQAVADWHSDIFDFIKSRDTYRHLVTTSFSNPTKDPAIWNLSQVDMITTHIYGLKDEAAQVYDACKDKLDVYAKPHIMAEFGLGAQDDWIKDHADDTGIHLHNALWAGAFTLSFGAPMPWYWDSYIEPNNLFTVFKPLHEFVKDIKWDRAGFYDLQSRDAYLKNPEKGSGGTVEIFPQDVWGKSPKNEFMVKPDGTVTNKNYFSGYIYGREHADMVNNPIITFNNETPVKLVIKIDKISDNNKLTVKINNQRAVSIELNAKEYGSKKYLENYKIYQADISREIKLDVPPGDNDILIENEGNDWVRIGSIRFENFMDPARSPIFVSGVQNNSSAYIWLKNKKYGYENSDPEPAAPSYLDVTGLLPGRYVITYFDTYEGKKIKTAENIVDVDVLRLDIPELKKDIAIKVVKYKR